MQYVLYSPTIHSDFPRLSRAPDFSLKIQLCAALGLQCNKPRAHDLTILHPVAMLLP